jgi:hypothetical protein
VQGAGYSKSKVEMNMATLELEMDATALELGTDTVALKLEMKTDVSQEISMQERYLAD